MLNRYLSTSDSNKMRRFNKLFHVRHVVLSQFCMSWIKLTFNFSFIQNRTDMNQNQNALDNFLMPPNTKFSQNPFSNGILCRLHHQRTHNSSSRRLSLYLVYMLVLLPYCIKWPHEGMVVPLHPSVRIFICKTTEQI